MFVSVVSDADSGTVSTSSTTDSAVLSAVSAGFPVRLSSDDFGDEGAALSAAFSDAAAESFEVSGVRVSAES